MNRPKLLMIAGPNGAGKTTSAAALLPEYIDIEEYINPDEIARQLNSYNPASENVSATRIMLRKIGFLIKERKNFAFETTAAPITLINILDRAKKCGYFLGMIFLWLPNPEICIERVKKRVEQGGHYVPEEIIVRRYNQGLKNSVMLYLPVMDEAVFFDNASTKSALDKVIAKKTGTDFEVLRADVWESIQKVISGDQYERRKYERREKAFFENNRGNAKGIFPSC